MRGGWEVGVADWRGYRIFGKGLQSVGRKLDDWGVRQRSPGKLRVDFPFDRVEWLERAERRRI